MNRHCLGQQSFKYFVETDPTVPQWVKKITLADIQNWNLVLNKQDILEAGQHIIIDGNVISFDHTIDELATDFQYFKIGDERIFNDLRNYFITLNEEEFIPYNEKYSTIDNTAYMQWQDGLYYYDDEYSPDNEYKVVKNGTEYDVFTYLDRATGDSGVFKNIINNLPSDLMLGFYKSGEKRLLRIENGHLVDSYTDYDDHNYEPELNSLFDLKKFFTLNSNTSDETTVYILSDYDIKHPEEVELNIIRVGEKSKVQPTDEFNSNYSYYTYNRNTDTYSPITLNENTFKQRQNGLYIRSSMWNPDTLLTSKNIDQLLYDTIGTAFGKIWTNRYNYFVENRLEDYVTSRINALNLNQYVDEDEMQIIINQIKDYVALNYVGNSEWNRVNAAIAAKQNNIYLQPMTMKTFVNGEAEYILRKKNEDEYAYGLNFERLDEEENYPYKLSLALDVLSDNETNEIYKSKFNIEPGYNGTDFYNLIDFHYGDTEYDRNTIYLSVPVATKIIDKPEVEAAVTVGALCRYLDGNFERKIVTLDSSIGFVDIAYYKELWGITGDNWTPYDYQRLLKEWYNVSINWDDENDQNIKNLYYDTHQRAINVNLTNENEIYSAEEWVAIENHSQSDYESRQESWYYSETQYGDKVLLSIGTWDEDEQRFIDGDTYPGNNKYYWKHGDISPKNKIPSVDAVAKFVESLDINYTDGKVKLSITERPNTEQQKIVNIDEATIVDDSVVNSNNTWSSNKISTELAKYVTLATNQTITGNKTFSGSNTFSNVNTFTNQIVLQGINSMIVGSPDGLTKKALLQRTSLNNTNLIVLGNTSDKLDLRSNGRPTYNNDTEQIAFLSDIEALPKPMIFKGTVGTNGTIAWSNLETPSELNKGWTYKVITAHATTVSSPSGNPKSQNWYELDVNNRYVLTKDTSVVSGKTYYENASNIGDVIISNPDINKWENIPSGDEPSGTVTNVATASESNSHLTLTTTNNNPITSTGTITAGVESGYSIPSTSKQTEWDSKVAGVQLNSVDLTKDANNKVNVIVPQVYRFV